jgi:alpha-glucosidase (family GH31 glycosyl hydrolase)
MRMLQWLVGSDLLVAPVLTEGATSVSVYMPGQTSDTLWYDTDTYSVYKAAAARTVAAPIDKTPVFQRGGSIIPKQVCTHTLIVIGIITCTTYTVLECVEDAMPSQYSLKDTCVMTVAY